MNAQKKVSVIVPVYKVEAFLPRCIDSILAQTFSDFELILVDDGSPDCCPQICDEYALRDPRVKVIHQENGGLSAARNAGLEIANGNFIAFVDSDDVVATHYLEYLYKAVTESHSDVAVCGFKSFENNLEFGNDSYEEGEIYAGKEMLWKIYSKDPIEYIKSTVAWNKLYKKSLFDQIRFPTGKIHEDEATTYKIYYYASKIVVLPTILYYYYQNREGIMKRKFNASRLDYLEALYDRYCFFQKMGLKDLASYTANLLYIFTIDYMSLHGDQVEEYASFQQRLITLYKSYRTMLLKQKLGWKNKIRILFSYIDVNFLIVNF